MDKLPPFNDKKNWRKLLARCHPDSGGDHELFLWATQLQEEVEAAYKRHEEAQRAPRQQPQSWQWRQPVVWTTTTTGFHGGFTA